MSYNSYSDQVSLTTSSSVSSSDNMTGGQELLRTVLALLVLELRL